VIPWQKIDRLRGAYSDGTRTYTAAALNPRGLVRPTPASSPSLFYLLFSAKSLGAADPGHWYRFYGNAAAAWYAASSATIPDPAGASATAGMAWLDASLPAAPPGSGVSVTAWQWANALFFCEAGTWTRRQDHAMNEGRLARRGARFGLSLAAPGAPGPASPWYIPRAGSLRERVPPPGSFDEYLAAALAPDDD
jgi:hypothetical protein